MIVPRVLSILLPRISDRQEWLSIDHWNCAIHGRPVIFHERDIGQDVTEIIPSFEPPFRLWLLAHYLMQVIVSYRPIIDASIGKTPHGQPRKTT